MRSSKKGAVGTMDILKKGRRFKQEGLRGFLKGCTSNNSSKLETKVETWTREANKTYERGTISL